MSKKRLFKLWNNKSAEVYFELWEFEGTKRYISVWGNMKTVSLRPYEVASSRDEEWAKETAKNYDIEIEDATKTGVPDD